MICEESIVFFILCFSYAVSSSCMPKYGIPSEWLPIARNVCYGTQNNDFGSFTMNRNCDLYAIRLSHVSGFQNVDKNDIKKRSRWGCSKYNLTFFCTLLIKDNELWYPKSVNPFTGYYKLDAFSIDDDVIVFKKNGTLAVGTQIQIGFGPDFATWPDLQNEGTRCVDVEMSCFV